MHSWNDAGEKKKGRSRIQYIDNIKKWTRASLEENVRLPEDRTARRERSCRNNVVHHTTDSIPLNVCVALATHLQPLAAEYTPQPYRSLGEQYEPHRRHPTDTIHNNVGRFTPRLALIKPCYNSSAKVNHGSTSPGCS